MLDEIKEILDMADDMQVRLDKLDNRRTFDPAQAKAVRSAANQMRGYRGWTLAELKAAFDPEYADRMKKLTDSVKR